MYRTAENELEITHSEYVNTDISKRRPFFHHSSSERSSRRFQSRNNRTLPLPKRFGHLFSTKPHKSSDVDVRDDSSYMAVATLHSAEGQQSVARTIHSQNTEKASNRQGPDGSNTDKNHEKSPPIKTRKGWKKLKRLVGEKFAHDKHHSKSSELPKTPSKKNMDLAIRGRLDGIDCMSLGPAYRSSIPSTEPIITFTSSQPDGAPINDGEDATRSSSLDFDPLQLSFTTLSNSYNPSNIVSDLIWTSRGLEQPELIFEGYASERWTLRFDKQSITPSSPLRDKSLCNFIPTLETIQDDNESASPDNNNNNNNNDNGTDNPFMGFDFWGTTIHSNTHERNDEQQVYDDDLLEVAAACSVPVDLDEGTFIIDSVEHLRTVQDLVIIPLQAKRFDKALFVFDKLLQGLGTDSDSDLELVVQSSTYHNIGIIQMCLGNFQEALIAFQKAVELRISFFSKNHPDVAVSLVRRGEAHFALGFFNDALDSFEQALGMSPHEDTTRAKILNNIGVVNYQCKNYDQALEYFVLALEIQRKWLDSSIRRQPIIYDTSVTLGNIGKLYLQKNEYKLSYSAFEESYKLQATAFPKDSNIVLGSLKSMGLVLAKNNQFSEALSIFRKILGLQEGRFGSESESFIETLGTIGCLLAKELDFEQSSKCLTKVLNWQKANLPPTSSKLVMTQATIDRVEDSADGKVSIWV